MLRNNWPVIGAGMILLLAAGLPADEKMAVTPLRRGESVAVQPVQPAVPIAPVLPPAPAGVADLSFKDFFKPVGARGLEYTDRIKSLEGKRVRLLGYMVRQEDPKPGLFLLAPLPVQLHEDEMGLADDLPAALVHVMVANPTNAVVPFTPGRLLLTGVLRLHPQEEADGRISTIRLLLDAPPSAAAAETISTPPVPAVRPAP